MKFLLAVKRICQSTPDCKLYEDGLFCGTRGSSRDYIKGIIKDLPSASSASLMASYVLKFTGLEQASPGNSIITNTADDDEMLQAGDSHNFEHASSDRFQTGNYSWIMLYLTARYCLPEGFPRTPIYQGRRPGVYQLLVDG